MTITCPFCGLCCDDLFVGQGAVETHGCAKASAGFARAPTARRPHAIAGIPAAFDAAVAAAAELLARAASPLVCGLSIDVHGVRAILALADRIGAIVDHRNSAALLANASVARASGWVTATFAEIANRADYILLVGLDPGRNFPRFFERLVDNPAPLYRAGPPDVAYLGTAAGAPDARIAPTRVVVDPAGMLGTLAALSAMLQGRPPRNSSPDLEKIAEGLRSAKYGAIVWDLAGFEPEEGEFAAEVLAGMLRRLNLDTRCVGLPLGGSENGIGAMQAALWQTGWPLRLRFDEGGPSHDPWRYDATRVLVEAEADLVLWIATLAADAPPDIAAPLIALVADDIDLPRPAAVEIRVGIPAIDHAGEIVRSDTVIALPLRAANPSDRSSVADVARRLLAAVEEQR